MGGTITTSGGQTISYGGGTIGTSGGGLVGSTGSGGGVYVSGMPVGLRDVPQMVPSYLTTPYGQVPYAETHTINRSESNTVTVTQSGQGSWGTWSVTITGWTKASDTVSGKGYGTVPDDSAATVSEVSSGGSTANDSYQLYLYGIYNDDTFTLTYETYYGTGTFNSTQTSTATTTAGEQFYTEQDSKSSDNYTVSWTATNNGGMMVFTNYSLDETVTAFYHSHQTTDPGYMDNTSNATTTIQANLSFATTASYSGDEKLDTAYDDVGPGGTEMEGDDPQDNPLSGVTDISSVIAQPTGWNWYAGTANAVNYSFSGSSSENATLSETAMWVGGGSSASALVVNTFNSYYQGSDSGQVQDDEPQTPASSGGSDTFARSETYGASDTVTGQGSYGAPTNATFQAVQVGTFNVNDTDTDNNETVSGTDDSGNPYTMNYNYSGGQNGNGSFTITTNYQDVGTGLTLTSESYQDSGTGQATATLSGTYNGQSFDDSSTVPESDSAQETVAGNGAPVTNPDGLIGSFPFDDMVGGNGAVFGAPYGGGGVNGSGGVFLQVNPARAIKTGVQGWYNSHIQAAGEGAKKKVAVLAARRETMMQITTSGKAMGTFTIPSRGNMWAQAMGEGDKLTRRQKSNVEALEASWDKVELGQVDVEITYAVDGAARNPRSGNAVLVYKYVQTFTGTSKRTGLPVSQKRVLFNGAIQFHDANLETIDLKE